MDEHRHSVRAEAVGPRLERGALVVGERSVPLLSGALHYFRLDPRRWRSALEAVRDLGLPMVESYVPWGVHEVAQGRFDFGERERRNDLGAFLDLAQELGLLVFLRPGPNVNAELSYFGLPRRIVLDQRNQARSPSGRPVPLIAPPRMFAVPSYASRQLRREVGRWFDAVGEVVAPRCWPDGPVVLLQVDNEAAFYFRDAPYDQDYHPDARAAYARFLEREYGDIAALNLAYQTQAGGFDEVEPPARMDATRALDVVRHLDWMRFHEWLIGDAMSDMVDQLARAGLGALPICHNLPMGEGGLPVTAAGLAQRVDLVGLDYYHSRSGLAHARRRTLRLAGSSPLPFAPELGVGAPPWFAPRSDEDALTAALCACAYGLRGFNLYMAVDRDRWYGAPIDAEGGARPAAARWRKLLDAVTAVGFHRLQRRVEIALSIPREYAWLSRATHSLGAISPSLLDLMGLGPSAACTRHDLGFAQPIQIAWSALLSRVADALTAAGVPYVFVESDRDLTALPELRAVFAPSFEFADVDRWQRLLDFARGGGQVLWGPRLPSMDARMRPARFEPPGERPPLQLGDQPEADDLVRALIDELSLPRDFAVAPRPLESSVHGDATGPRVVFLVNPGAERLDGELHLPFPCELTDALAGDVFGGDSSVAIPVAARSCRMLLCERRGRAASRPRPPSARARRQT